MEQLTDQIRNDFIGRLEFLLEMGFIFDRPIFIVSTLDDVEHVSESVSERLQQIVVAQDFRDLDIKHTRDLLWPDFCRIANEILTVRCINASQSHKTNSQWRSYINSITESLKRSQNIGYENFILDNCIAYGFSDEEILTMGYSAQEVVSSKRRLGTHLIISNNAHIDTYR